MIMNPTKKPIRNDKGGQGNYGASRRKTEGGRIIRYLHQGTDYQCTPGQDILAPCTGTIKAVSMPYSGSHYSGVLLEGHRLTLQMWYFYPDMLLIGQQVKIGQVIGKAQDISKRYNGVTPHIHLQIIRCDPELLIHDTPDNI